MDVREKLVELLKTSACPSTFICDPTCKYYGFEDCFPERFADYLISHDVTVQVVHGRWETNSDRPDTLICSICKCGFDMWKHDPHNFCPNCGARMDGDSNG